ncbi:MAG: hypothetical protein KKF44_11080, partial [Nanoarchaeota archaeon]|nr:hypothetical protein [Nanoarchaeota archaeon]
MHYTILDCYTDEPAGLGVPPYIGTYPRYIFGKLSHEDHDVKYLTIDDLRLSVKYDGKRRNKEDEIKTDIRIYNITKNNAHEILKKTDVLIVIAGVHVPGKYLSAYPGTVKEAVDLLKRTGANFKKI